MARHWTPEEKDALREQAAEMRAAGVGAKRIAQQLGIPHGLTQELLRGVPVPSSLARPNAKDDLREEAALALRAQGRTYDEIRLELGCSKSSLSLWLRHLPHPTPDERAAAAGGGAVVPLAEAPPDRVVARQLREDGWLLREIAEELGVSPKTAFVWTSGIPVPGRAKHGRSAEETRAMARKRWEVVLAEREQERQRVMAESAATVGDLSCRELELIAVTAYVCEGTKSKPWNRQERLTFVNSDPYLIQLFCTWLRALGVSEDRIGLRVAIHETADLCAAEAFWGDVTRRSVDSFARATMKRHNPKTVRKNVGESYYGCLTVDVKQSRLLYQHVMGVWRGIAEAATRHLPGSSSRQDIGL